MCSRSIRRWTKHLFYDTFSVAKWIVCLIYLGSRSRWNEHNTKEPEIWERRHSRTRGKTLVKERTRPEGILPSTIYISSSWKEFQRIFYICFIVALFSSDFTRTIEYLCSSHNQKELKVTPTTTLGLTPLVHFRYSEYL